MNGLVVAPQIQPSQPLEISLCYLIHIDLFSSHRASHPSLAALPMPDPERLEERHAARRLRMLCTLWLQELDAREVK